MAASDKTYRNQYRLDIVFAVSSILLLVSSVLMFVQDYNREFKEEQRAFRDVEVAVAQRVALAQLPTEEEFDKAEKQVEEARKERESKTEKISELEAKIAELTPYKEKSEKNFQDVKAVLESRVSFFNIDVDEHGIEHAREKYAAELKDLEAKLEVVKAERDKYVEEIKSTRRELDEIKAPLVEAQSTWKKLNDKFEAQVNLSITKEWGAGDYIRALPIIDGFASPLKIHQYTINDVPIDYNFKYVTRFDRCVTCHQGIDNPAYSKEMLKSLTDPESKAKLEDRLQKARARLKQRKEALAGLPEAAKVPDPDALTLSSISAEELTQARITEFAAHPRLDLFVGSNSKHPAEKFGCTSCHSGQGSGTNFNNASHSPNSSAEMEEWAKKHHWESNHMWDFPMHPTRFVESSCIKCHHEVTDLISADNREEAPKVLRGYNLIREFGCFGCHEIQGRKGGRPVGPDMRLEPYPPLDTLTPTERDKIEADVDNPPGELRKVGPSLYRLAEKTNPEWVVKWLSSPRSFRPDTRMPHFYGVSNNTKDVLPEEQKNFPDVEMQALTYYLFNSSNKYLEEVKKHQPPAPGSKDYDAYQAAVAKDVDRLRVLQALERLQPAEKQEMEQIQWRQKLREAPLLDLDPAPGHKPNLQHGRQLFTERGCLACHSHDATEKALGNANDYKTYEPAITSKAQFGPDLSMVAAKLGSGAGDKKSARAWLTQWIRNPNVHSPRTKMPITHLQADEAMDVAEWLLSQEAQGMGKDWASINIPEPNETQLKDLAKVYLTRLMRSEDMDKLLAGEQIPPYMIEELPNEERELASVGVSTKSLKYYLGKKAVSRLGCYACHDMPNFDYAKPIGVGLNDWGKKDPTRLAFEDIANFVKENYHIVPSLTDEKGQPIAPVVEDGKTKIPYEKYFADLLMHHQREGYLNQKLLAPRSYDYNRIRAWDDRSRMPQFRFARTRKKAEETDEQFAARTVKAEADAREAVMTFVLGLVAENVPMKSISQPEGDRKAEVLGRKVLDKFNCAGCHLIRAGIVEFKTTPEALEALEGAHSRYEANPGHVFPNHYNWAGKNPTSPDKLTMYGSLKPFDDESLFANPTHALRFRGSDGKLYDIAASTAFPLPINSLISPPVSVASSEEALTNYMEKHGPWGGAFADLIVKYLTEKERNNGETIYRLVQGDSANARAAGPPILIAQGERTQPNWLYQFLLDPQRVRNMTVLRMPKFNMSKEDARQLVNYFAAVSRLENTGISIPYPYEETPQSQDLSSPYWHDLTAKYVNRLKKTKTSSGSSQYQLRLDEFQPLWKAIEKDYKDQLDKAQTSLKEFAAASAKAKAAAEKAKADDKTKQEDANALAIAQKSAEDKEASWQAEVDRLQELVKSHDVASQKKRWEEQEAYLVDAYRLVANKQLCLQCHQVGTMPALGKTQGPSLLLGHQRLRPEWTGRWIAAPQRFLTYPSVMPNNFPADKNNLHQEWLAGSSLQQSFAARDAVMALPRAEALPLSRYWALPLPGDQKK